MTVLSIAHLPAWAVALSLAAHLAIGIGLGLLYFRTLWWNTRLLAEGRRTTTAVALMLGRFVLLAGLLTLASLEGALPLLVMALGILIARSAVLRRLRMITP